MDQPSESQSSQQQGQPSNPSSAPPSSYPRRDLSPSPRRLTRHSPPRDSYSSRGLPTRSRSPSRPYPPSHREDRPYPRDDDRAYSSHREERVYDRGAYRDEPPRSAYRDDRRSLYDSRGAYDNRGGYTADRDRGGYERSSNSGYLSGPAYPSGGAPRGYSNGPGRGASAAGPTSRGRRVVDRYVAVHVVSFQLVSVPCPASLVGDSGGMGFVHLGGRSLTCMFLSLHSSTLSGSETERRESTTIYVGNLPYSFRERDVADLFERYGRLRKITVLMDNYTSRNKGFAFVEFEDRRDAEDAFDMYNGFSVEGRRLKLDWDIGMSKKDAHRGRAPVEFPPPGSAAGGDPYVRDDPPPPRGYSPNYRAGARSPPSPHRR